MKTNLSSQITLNRVSPRYYQTGERFRSRSVLTRLEKIPTDIYESPGRSQPNCIGHRTDDS